MALFPQDFRCRTGIHHLAMTHDGDPVGKLRHDREVVRDEQQAHLLLLHQLSQQVEDLCLDHDVERRGGLVGNEQLRLHRAGHGDHHPLALAARQFVRIAVERKPAFRQADTVE
jgi:hypothetical protein